MDPEVLEAIPHLVRAGILPPDKAPLLLRIAGGKLTSVYQETRLLLYGGVLLITASAGVLVKDNYARIGPLATLLLIGAAAAACFAWIAKTAPHFSWGQTASPSLAFEYILMLGVLLAAAALGFAEVQFAAFGRNWPWHLLIVSLLMEAAAVRYDSRMVFALALSTFAAWRGISISLLEHALWGSSTEAVVWNGIVCGVFVIALGLWMKRHNRKAHFQPACLHLGWLILLGALVAGGFGHSFGGYDSTRALAYSTALLLVGATLACAAFLRRRFPLFAFGVIGAYIGAAQLIFRFADADVAGIFWLGLSALVVVACLWKAQVKMRQSV